MTVLRCVDELVPWVGVFIVRTGLGGWVSFCAWGQVEVLQTVVWWVAGGPLVLGGLVEIKTLWAY